MIRKLMTEGDLHPVVRFYMECYNEGDDDDWTYEIASKRIMQVLTKSDSPCFIYEEKGMIVGFAMGYCEQFIRSSFYFLTEVLVSNAHRGKGLGTEIMEDIEIYLKDFNVNKILLLAANDEMHKHFYGKLGYEVDNAVICMEKRLV